MSMKYPDRQRARFWDKTSLHPSGCLMWTAGTNAPGYGVTRNILSESPYLHLAHRQAYMLMRGEDIGDTRLKHTAPVAEGVNYKLCVNHEHWEPETGMEWEAEAGKTYQNHCARGHEFTPENTRSNGAGGRVCRQCNKIHQAAFREARGDSNPYRKKKAARAGDRLSN